MPRREGQGPPEESQDLNSCPGSAAGQTWEGDSLGVSFLFYEMRFWNQMISNGDQGGNRFGVLWRMMSRSEV